MAFFCTFTDKKNFVEACVSRRGAAHTERCALLTMSRRFTKNRSLPENFFPRSNATFTCNLKKKLFQ